MGWISFGGIYTDVTQPVKPFATIEDQIDLLVSRGMALDRQVAEQWLRNVGYYRLSGYWYPYRQLSERVVSRRDAFTENAQFDDVVRLYEFDRKLRTLIHDGVERVEVALRSHVSYLVGSHGPLAYSDARFFRPTFDHDTWLETARRRMDRAAGHSEAIRHHRAHYAGAVPIWVLTDVLDFADVSRMYDGLRARDQWTVAERLGVAVDDSGLSANQRKKVRAVHPLARWLEQLTIVRNAAAHHARVWNRSFTPVGTAALRSIDELSSLPEGQSERLYGALTVMGYLLQTASPGTTWSTKVRVLMDQGFEPLHQRSVAEMGFPGDWRDAALWSRRS